MAQQSPARAGATLLPPLADADGTRRRLQEVALRQFAERGYHGVSVREIAAAAGVRASSLYAHYASKEELLHDLILLGHRYHNQALREAILSSGSDPADQLQALVRTHVYVHAEYPLLAMVANSELRFLPEERSRDIWELRLDGQRLLEDVVARGRAMGTFTVADPFLAIAALGAIGLRVPHWFDPDGPYDVSQVADAYATFALKIVT